MSEELRLELQALFKRVMERPELVFNMGNYPLSHEAKLWFRKLHR